jgi:D-aminoacyl-tRNA deacylase
MKLILYSMDDLAGANIAKKILERGFEATCDSFEGATIYKKGDILLFGTKTNVKDLKYLPYKPDVCVVASRHKSESGKPTLTCHPTGNFSKAELGGEPGRLQPTNAQYLRQSLILLQEQQKKHGLPYEVSMEVTHHGPTELPFPLLYVEVGSSEEQWKDEKACLAVAEVIWEIMSKGVEDTPPAIGFGGPHYAPNFNQAAKKYAIGHIMPKHHTENLDKAAVEEMLDKTLPRPDTAILDWKGLKGAEKTALQDILGGLGVKIIRTSELK